MSHPNDEVEQETRAAIERIADHLQAHIAHTFTGPEKWAIDRALTEAVLIGAMTFMQQQRKP